MHDALHLVRTRRFLPIFTTQFLGAFNDNLFKNAMVLFVVYSVYNSEEAEAQFSAIASGLFILPFFLFSALAGQLADAPLLRRCRRSCLRSGRRGGDEGARPERLPRPLLGRRGHARAGAPA